MRIRINSLSAFLFFAASFNYLVKFVQKSEIMKLKLILAGLIVLSIVSCRRKSSDDYNYYKPYKADSVAVAEPAEKVDTIIENEAPVEKTVEVKGVDLSDNYFIVVASFTVEEYANTNKAELIKQGYKPEIFMINDDGWFKLAVESYKSKEDAKAALARLQAKGDIFSQARIVFKKSK